MKVGIKNASENKHPEYAHIGDAGLDIRNSEDYVIIEPKGSAIISTGIYVNIPEGYEIQVRGRSGLSFKNDIIAHFGTIDSNYTGEIKVKLYNLGNTQYEVVPGERIAQLVLSKVETIEWIDSFTDNTNRGDTGFGDSGKI